MLLLLVRVGLLAVVEGAGEREGVPSRGERVTEATEEEDEGRGAALLLLFVGV